jgi:hypothetical protein
MLAPLILAAATALPTISISVHASPNVSRSLVALALEEADAIWRDAGLRLSWRMDGEKRIAKGAPDGAAPAMLRLVIDDDPGPAQDGVLAIGWVIFVGDEPRPEIHLSYANAVTGLQRACPIGTLYRLLKSQIDDLVAPALGRALAHELGHYLLGNKAHSAHGLMQAGWSPAQMFGDDRPYFHLDAAQRGALAQKTATLVTSR